MIWTKSPSALTELMSFRNASSIALDCLTRASACCHWDSVIPENRPSPRLPSSAPSRLSVGPDEGGEGVEGSAGWADRADRDAALAAAVPRCAAALGAGVGAPVGGES